MLWRIPTMPVSSSVVTTKGWNTLKPKTRNAPKTIRQSITRKEIFTVIVIALILFGGYEYQNWALSKQSTTSSIYTSSTSLPYITLRPSDFNMTYSSGCLFFDENRTNLYDYFSVAIGNRWNETVQYVNASIVIVSAHFSNGTTEVASFSNYTAGPLLVARASNTTILKFGIPLPISSPKFGRFYLVSAVLSILVCIKQNGEVQSIPIRPNIVATNPAPPCSV
jgi:hypothetical protein